MSALIGRPSFLAVATLGFAVALSSCGLTSSPSVIPSSAGTGSQKTVEVAALAALVPDNVKKAGVIRMATDPNYPPFSSMAGDGKTVVGFDADLAHAIAETLGLKIEFVPTSFDAIIPALSAGRVDMAMSSIGDTKKREAVVDFATYYWNGTLMLVPVGNPKDIKADMACGARIGVIRGSLQQSTFLPSQAPACKQAGRAAPIGQAYQTGPQAQLALKSGRIDGVMQDAPTVLDVVKKAPEAFSTAGPLKRNPNPGGAAFPKGSNLADPVSKAINALIKSGAYADILHTWNLSAIAVKTSQINGALS